MANLKRSHYSLAWDKVTTEKSTLSKHVSWNGEKTIMTEWQRVAVVLQWQSLPEICPPALAGSLYLKLWVRLYLWWALFYKPTKHNSGQVSGPWLLLAVLHFRNQNMGPDTPGARKPVPTCFGTRKENPFP